MINEKEFLTIAKQSQLEFAPEELQQALADFDEVIAYMQILDTIEVSADMPQEQELTMHKDQHQNGLTIQQALRNAKYQKESMFTTKRIIS